MSERLALGLDLSTQSLSCLVLSFDGDVVYEDCLNFDAELPHYGTRSGMVSFPPGYLATQSRNAASKRGSASTN